MRACPFCKNKKSLFFCLINEIQIVKCPKCALLFTQPPGQFNPEKYNALHYSDEYVSGYENRRNQLANRFKSKLKKIEDFVHGRNLLDVGCGTGLFLKTVQENAVNKWDLFGIDINKNSIKQARKNINASFFCTSLHKKKFKENFFDCITCFDVLEHDTDINGNLKEILRVLNSEGVLVIQVPNSNSIMAFLCGENWDWWSVPDHVLHFSPVTLTQILLKNDFKIQKLITWEPSKEFVENIRGTIKKNVTTFCSMNRILSKFFILPLYLFWVFLHIFEKRFNTGGLIVVYAIKAK